jgi:calcineurin-like phosphoesterase family protein
MLNVGVDAWGYSPVSAATLAAIINSGRNDL